MKGNRDFGDIFRSRNGVQNQNRQRDFGDFGDFGDFCLLPLSRKHTCVLGFLVCGLVTKSPLSP